MNTKRFYCLKWIPPTLRSCFHFSIHLLERFWAKFKTWNVKWFYGWQTYFAWKRGLSIVMRPVSQPSQTVFINFDYGCYPLRFLALYFFRAHFTSVFTVECNIHSNIFNSTKWKYSTTKSWIEKWQCNNECWHDENEGTAKSFIFPFKCTDQWKSKPGCCRMMPNSILNT